ncbi:hypothetical protein ASG66_03305 [Bacillus sp. Leaf406]|nr:hypothetical protein ASG66_03305 [Bacillus sp. Leaf406]
MGIIGFMVIFLLFIVLIAFGSIMTALMVRKTNTRAPRKLSFLVLGLLILHWIFWLSSGYEWFSDEVAEAIFNPIWGVLCAAGLAASLYELRHNKSFAFPVGALSGITLMFVILVNGITSM